jgi:two-component sensor histidine kinase
VDDPDKKELILKVGDNGKGIDLKEVSANSFGLKLIHTFVRQLGARMDIHNEKGTVFNISFTYA